MDGYVLPDRNQFLQFLKKLKEVFDACDEHADGFIRVQRFVDLGLRFGQGDEVKTLTKFLDPNAHGKINFKDFCHGVFAIKGCEDMFEAAVGPYFVPEVRPSFTDNGYIYQNGEGRRAPAVTVCTRPQPDWGPYQGQDRGPYQGQDRGPYQVPGDGDMMDSSAEHADSDTGLEDGSSPASAILGEEQFEDYGEGVDLTPSSPGGEETHNTGFSHRGTSSAGQTPPKMRPLDNNELLDVFCSQCCKKVNLLNDLEARLRDLKASSPNRKMSSRAFGRQLVQSNAGVFGGSAASSTEDLLADSMEPCDITEKVIFLEKKVTELESDRAANGDLKSKLKQENTHLVHRVHELEEEVKDVEVRAEQSLEEELRRHKEAYGRVQREHSAQIELLSNKVQQLEENNQEMKLNVCRLKSQTEKLDQEKQRMTDQLEDSSLQLKDEMELYREVVDQLWLHRHQFHKEKEAMQEVTEDLRRQLERLQLFRLEVEQPGEGWGRAQARAREVQLEVKRLQQENHKLRDQNDDLNAQILSLSLYEAKNLLASHTKAQCLAAEIQTATRDELVDAVKEQEENNYRLRQYMDKIILAILDHNPSILEIKKE
ncbi:rab11 family-interacting protein 4A isoform X1 [Gadus morhua]|uniref:RAB11 family interacting protein 4 (class II) a n=1 Tax=Gadus morhua TaxID=8049 RepID=A0A8C5A507_GADMO|nr:rab11 family-interacting protein 4A-like isoform X1 [Gadus morhua]